MGYSAAHLLDAIQEPKALWKKEDQRKRKNARSYSKLNPERYVPSTLGIMGAKQNVDWDRVIRKHPADTILYGIELEIERTPELTTLDDALKLIGAGYICYDGSLTTTR